jgi:hypothetical protein
LCFGGIIDRFGGTGIKGALLLFLASIVYHADFLLKHIADNSGHAFQSIPVLSKPTLLLELQALVTLEPASDVIQATGVPCHVKMMDKVKELYSMLGDYMAEERSWRSLPNIIKDSIDEKAAESGHVTAKFVLDTVSTAFEKSTTTLGQKIEVSVKEAARVYGFGNNSNRADVNCTYSTNRQPTSFPTYKYHDQHATGRNKNRRIGMCQLTSISPHQICMLLGLIGC